MIPGASGARCEGARRSALRLRSGQALGCAGDDKGEGGASVQVNCWLREPQIPPLRFAPVGTTIHIMVRTRVPKKILIPKKSQSLGMTRMTKGRAALRFRLIAGGENRRSLHFASLRSGRRFILWYGRVVPKKILIPKKSQSLGMTKGRAALRFRLIAGGENRRSLHFACAPVGTTIHIMVRTRVPKKILIPKKSQSLGMTKGRAALRFRLIAGGENRRSLHFACAPVGTTIHIMVRTRVPKKILIPKKSQSLGMTKGRAALRFRLIAGGENRRSLHFATLRSGRQFILWYGRECPRNSHPEKVTESRDD